MHLNSFRLALLGESIAHSLSPIIHQAFAEQAGLSLQYDKITVPIGGFRQAAEAFMQSGGHGFNITMPFKQQAHDFVQRLTPRARTAGAVNTIGRGQDGVLWGDNTDGAGLMLALHTDLGLHLAGKTLLILGAGGAAQGILPALLAEAPAQIGLYHRHVAKAQALAMQAPQIIRVIDSDNRLDNTPDIVINALPKGVNILPLPITFKSETLAYDLNYGAERDAFGAWAKAHGVLRYSDGISMLVWQAALAFALWTGFTPDVLPVLKALRSG